MIATDVKDNETYLLAFDKEKFQPGCVLIQAMYGANGSIAHLFDTDSWLLAPTANMRSYRIKGDLLKELAEAVNEERKK